MKTATFTVHATEQQSARWKMAAAAGDYSSVGSWLAHAADTYLRQLACRATRTRCGGSRRASKAEAGSQCEDHPECDGSCRAREA